MQFVVTVGALKGMAAGEIDFQNLGVVLTNTAHNAAYEKTSSTGFTPVTNHFASDALTVSAMTYDLAGDGKLDIVCPDQDLDSDGGDTGPFQYVYLYEKTHAWLIGYYDYGSAQTIPDGEALEFRATQADDIILSLSRP